MSGIEFIQFVLEATGALSIGFLVAKWHTKGKRYRYKRRKRRKGETVK